jgi:hypothetical protein
MKNTNEVLRQQARNEFFSTSAPLNAIADKVGVARKTVSIWATEGNWQALKINSMRTPAILVDGMYAELSELADAIAARPHGERYPTPKEADVRRKTILSIKDLKKGIATPEMHELLKSFAQFIIARGDERTAIRMSRFIHAFLNETDKFGYLPHQVEFKVGEGANPNADCIPQDFLPEPPGPILLSSDPQTDRQDVIDDIILPEPPRRKTSEYYDIMLKGYKTPEETNYMEYEDEDKLPYFRQQSRLLKKAAQEEAEKAVQEEAEKTAAEEKAAQEAAEKEAATAPQAPATPPTPMGYPARILLSYDPHTLRKDVVDDIILPTPEPNGSAEYRRIRDKYYKTVEELYFVQKEDADRAAYLRQQARFKAKAEAEAQKATEAARQSDKAA